LQCALVKELDGAQCQGTGAAGDFFDILEIEKILAQFFFTDLAW
jgi:hypothetical protein